MAPSSLPGRLAAATLACAALSAVPLPAGLRCLGALPLLLYLPGRCWLLATMPAGPAGGEREVLAAAVSLALAVLLGLLLACLGLLGQAGWISGLVLFNLACCGLAAATRPDLRAGTSIPVPFTRAWCGAGVMAVTMAVLAFAAASRGAIEHQPDRYTDLWLVPQGGPVPSLATAGMRNREGRDASYTFDIVARGRIIDRAAPFVLHPGEERTLRIPLPSRPDTDDARRPSKPTGQAAGWPSDDAEARDRLEFRLFRDGDRREAYRRVWVALPPVPAPQPTVTPEDALAGDLTYAGSLTAGLRAPLRVMRPMPASEATEGSMAPPARAAFVDATHPVTSSQAVALTVASGPDVTFSLRASEAGDAVASLRARRFAPSSADPPPRASD